MNEFVRDNYSFRSFLDVDVEPWHQDIWGVEIYEDGVLIAVVDWAEIVEVSEMNDEEIYNFVEENRGVGI